MKHLLGMTAGELAAEIQSLGERAFRARQIAEWVWKKRAVSFSEMSDLPAELRGRLAGRLEILTARLVRQVRSADGTLKGLLELHDAEHIEAVAIPTAGRLTACVSTQVGCAMGCAFCATGLEGLRRNLTAGEIVEQVFHLQAAAGRRVTNVVFMGMGEPLANYGATVSAVRALIDPERMGLSARHVTVSTIGLPKPIRRLAAEKLPITLAISLHAPTDALRRRLVPAAGKVALEDILEAAEVFYQSRHRELTLEYVLLAGVNDTRPCAEALGRIALRLRCNVNLILYNSVSGLEFERPAWPVTHAFAQQLRSQGVNVHLRRSRGLDIAGACGQLRQSARQDSAR